MQAIAGLQASPADVEPLVAEMLVHTQAGMSVRRSGARAGCLERP